MDNQQPTKSWFIGFLEGEGCFIERRKKIEKRLNRREINYQPCQVRISNTEIDLIHICQRFLSQNGILHYVVTSKRGKNKQMYEIYISGETECKILYELIKDSMDCRINELEHILGGSTTTRETTFDLNWLIGFFEAEGCFTISTQYHKNERISHRPDIIMENTNFIAVEKTVKSLYNIGQSWYIWDRCFRDAKYKPSRIVRISGYKRVISFLNKTHGLWIGSKTQRKVKLLTEFCNSRLSKESKEPYSNREYQIAQEIKSKI